jgi:glycine/sarcosine N-methyltransferase
VAVDCEAGTERPFYGQFAWAYDALVETPISQQCGFIDAQLRRRGVTQGAHVFDAGYGTGGHAIALAGLGYRVTGVDLSPELLAEARRKATVGAPVAFVEDDLTRLPDALGSTGDADAGTTLFDAVLCRGVLNDLLDDERRARAFAAFARCLCRGGVLVLDVREWDGSVRRKEAEPAVERLVQTNRGPLRFRAVTRLEPSSRRLLVSEEHRLAAAGATSPSASATDVAVFDFTMRCWTTEELQGHLARAGFLAAELFGGYDEAIPAGATDRMVAIALRT